MNLLAIDTSTDYLSIAIMRDGKICARHHKKASRMHSTLLAPAIERLLKRARVKLKDLDALCISVGPGSFTGLRIGVTTVKAFAYALKKRIAAVPTLDVIADHAKSFRGMVCPVLDARKGKVYACLYKSDGENIKRVSPYMLLSADELASRIRAKKGRMAFLGDKSEEFIKNLPTNGPATITQWHPRADVVARLGLEYLREGKTVTAAELEPLYIYSKECDILGK